SATSGPRRTSSSTSPWTCRRSASRWRAPPPGIHPFVPSTERMRHMADHDHVPYIVIERHSGGAAPFLWGLLLGAGAALLLAPRSGEETQAEIRERARRLRSSAEDRVDSVRGTVTDRVSRTREQVQDRFD